MTQTAPPPPAARPLRLAEGFALLQQGRFEEAGQLVRALVAAHPEHPEVRFLASESSLAEGDSEGSLEHLLAAVARLPGERSLLVKLAENYVMLRRRDDAKAVAARIAAAGDPEALFAAGRIHARCDDPARAAGLLEGARAGGHPSPALLYELAAAQHFMGEEARAAHNLHAMLARVPNSGPAMYLRSTLRRQTPEENNIADLERRLAGNFPSEASRVAAEYALAKELEDIGDSARAFTVLATAAARKRRTVAGYDVAAETANIDALCATWSADALAAATPGHDEDGPIFVVGLPRTGTTLVERILSRHPQVGSAGELLDFGQALAAAARRAHRPGMSPVEASRHIDFAALGRDYLRGAREAAPPRPRFVDKLPVNYIYCGLIRQALPKARIVHVRRDPMDAGYAMFKTLFSQAYLFSYGLREIADYIACHERTMRHWQAVLPGTIVEVRYEDLVADPETQARRLLEACGLAWDPGVLDPAGNDQPSTTASATQVREPIHARSVSRWREHEAGLAPLRDRLVELGVLQG